MKNTVTIKVFTLEHGKDLSLPTHATYGSAGVDLLAATQSDIILEPLQRVLVPTGLTISLPQGYEAQIRPRSGLALKNGITVLNTPGTIDSDYIGEVKILLINFGNESFLIQRGMRIAQMVIGSYSQVHWDVQSSPLKPSEGDRDAFGFGSTGI